jgi:hypothetical protein
MASKGVPRTDGESGDHSPAGSVALSGTGAAASPAGPSPAEQKNALRTFLDWFEPYRQLAAILVAVVASVSGGVAWIVAHVVTHAEMESMECMIKNDYLNELMPIHVGEFADKIEWRNAQIKELAQHGGATQQSIDMIVDLSDQVTILTKEQGEAAVKLKSDIAEFNKSCISETPKFGTKP